MPATPVATFLMPGQPAGKNGHENLSKNPKFVMIIELSKDPELIKQIFLASCGFLNNKRQLFVYISSIEF